MPIRICQPIGLLVLIVLSDSGQARAAGDRFRSDIVPLLKQHCIACHGPAKTEAGLNLATPSGIRRGGSKGRVIEAGSLEKSRLWQLVESDEMPPEGSLSARDREKLRQWILDGAKGLPTEVSARPDGDEHWAFQRLVSFLPGGSPVTASSKRLRLAKPRDRSGVRTPIDLFIQARLERAGLSLSPEAGRETLIRRVSLDLTGVPPSPEERAQFLKDREEDAYARMVDRYLASERFGERWGKYWLDAAGYADSNGYFGADTDRPLAYRYRDYVIRSLNADKPWDQFVREQLAGDELAGYGAGAEVAQHMLPLLEAVHYLRNSPDGTDSSDGNPDEVRRDKYAALEGTLEIMGASLLGLTVGCARCHDHKFEPFTQRDYYQLQAVIYPAFNVANWVKPKERTIRAASKKELAAWQAEMKRIDRLVAQQRDAFREWLREHGEPAETVFSDRFDKAHRRLAGTWSNTAPTDDAPGGIQPVTIDSRNAPAAIVEAGRLHIIESGAAGDRVCCTVKSFDWTPPAKGDWIQVTFDLDARGDPAPYVGYFIALRDFNDARALKGGNVLIDGRRSGKAAVHVDYPGSDSQSRGVIGISGYEPERNLGVRITNAGDGRFEIAQVVEGIIEPGVVTLSAEDLPDGAFGFEYCCNRSFVVDNVLIERSVVSESGKLSPTELAEVRRQAEQQRKKLAEETAALNESRPREPGHVAIVADYSPDIPDVPLLVRGEHKTPGKSVPAAAPHVLADSDNPIDLDAMARSPLGASKNSTGRRLAFARWLTRPGSRASALLARVTVNRWWQYHFGIGLVSTPENLGYSGAVPTHPELLEFLAAELVRNNWRPKALHRLILLSAVYRQQSTSGEKSRRLDPDYRLLSRYPIRRLDAEAIRDSMLAVSGQLDETRYGPYVPTEYAPDGRVVVKSNSRGRLRRSIYLQQRRTQTPELLKAFDAPSIVASCTGRSRTTVPPQALTLMNSPNIRERAAAAATRLEADRKLTDDEFINQAFSLMIAREPRPAEQTASIEFLTSQPKRYQNASGSIQRARTDFMHMLLAWNGFLYIE